MTLRKNIEENIRKSICDSTYGQNIIGTICDFTCNRIWDVARENRIALGIYSELEMVLSVV